MNLTTYVMREAVLLSQTPVNKEKLLIDLCHSLRTSPALRDEPYERMSEVVSMVLHREADHAPTGLGVGVAMPHARLTFTHQPAVALAVLKQPLAAEVFRAPDEVPISLVCMLLAPDDNPTLSLHIQAECVRLLSQPALREKILMAEQPDAVYQLFAENEVQIDRSLTARDVMLNPNYDINPTTPLRTITHQMSRKRLTSTPVVDEKERLVGHITCERLFHFGLPDFFTQLKSVSFIKDFDPFAKYFFQEAQATAADIMTTDFCAMPPEATLLEVVFALTTLRQPHVYVVEHERLIGRIDQGAVLQHVINF